MCFFYVDIDRLCPLFACVHSQLSMAVGRGDWAIALPAMRFFVHLLESYAADERDFVQVMISHIMQTDKSALSSLTVIHTYVLRKHKCTIFFSSCTYICFDFFKSYTYVLIKYICTILHMFYSA